MSIAQVDLTDVQELVNPGVTVVDVLIGLGVLLFGILGAFAIRRLSRRWLGRFDAGSSRSAQVVVLALQVFVILVALIAGLDFLGLNLTPAVIALVFGLAVIFIASRDMVTDFGSGLVLQARGPLRPGEYATVDGVTGRVVEIDERVVRLETIEGDIVVVPNSTVVRGQIRNLSRSGVRSSMVAVPIAYGTDLARAREAMSRALAECDLVHDDPVPQIYLEAFGGSSVDFRVRFWHRAGVVERLAAVDEALDAIYAHLDRDGIEIPLPQRVIHWAPGGQPGSG